MHSVHITEVIVTESALNEFIGAPNVIQARIFNVFERLVGWPDVSGWKIRYRGSVYE